MATDLLAVANHADPALLDHAAGVAQVREDLLELGVSAERLRVEHDGFEAARLSLAGFLIPFVFVYHPAVLYKLQVLFELADQRSS